MWLSGLAVLVGAGLLAYLFLRPNRAKVAPGLHLQTRELVHDGWHNGFTDLVFWRGSFHLVYVASPAHFASPRSRLVLLASSAAQTWTETARLTFPGQDIRDPKLAVIRDELFLFALLNKSWDPQPYTTVYAKSIDGVTWTPFREIEPVGWLFGHPKTADGVRWFVSAHWREFNRVGLFSSTDGESWQVVAICIAQPGLDETALEFLPDGRALLAIRSEAGGGLLGAEQAGTLLLSSEPPYTQWAEPVSSRVTRLDSPNLFRVGDRVLAVGRHQPRISRPFHLPGSTLSRKRTALFLVTPGQLTYLSDLPSAGDTAYAGVAQQEGRLLVSYYSSTLKRDYPWLLGMFCSTSIQLASIDLAGLEELCQTRSIL
jgi:hypothetical protein